MSIKYTLAAATAALFLGSGVTHAGLLDSSVTVNLEGVGFGGPLAGPITVTGGSVEFPGIDLSFNGDPAYSADITDSRITVSHYQNGFTTSFSGDYNDPASINGFEFVFTNAPAITGASLNISDSTLRFPLTPPRITFTDNSIFVNFAGSFSSGDAPPDSYAVDVTFAPVPEPSTGALAFAGMVAIGIFVRLRVKTAHR